MSWRSNLGFCLLVLTAAGCGAAGRASLPVESAPDAGTVSAAAESASPALPAPDVAVLKAIRVAPGRTSEGGFRVEIDASSPVNYTSYEPNADSFILEIPNADVTALPASLPISEADGLAVRVAAIPAHGGGTHARIEFVGRSEIQARVSPEGSTLAVVVTPMAVAPMADAGASRIGAEPTAAAAMPAEGRSTPPEIQGAAAPIPATPAQTAVGAKGKAEPQPAAARSAGPASEISGVVVEGTGPVTSVAIIGDGELKHSEFTLKSPDRLVLDVTGVSNRVAEKSFDVSSARVQRVRVAQFRTKPEKVVRIVFDLAEPTPHTVVTDSDGLRVLFGDEAQIAEAASPTRPAAPRVAEARETEEVPAMKAPAEAPAAAPAATPTNAGTPAKAAPAAPLPTVVNQPSAQMIPPLPDLTPRLVPSGPGDLDKNLVLFDRSDPAQETKPETGGGSMLAQGVTFQSQTIAGEKRHYRGDKISVTFRDADIREVFFFFSDVMKMNIVLDPDVTGKIDIRLTQVPWDQAFQVILKNQGLDATEEDNVIRIARTQKLRAEAAERRALKQAQEQEVDPITFTRQLSYAKVTDTLLVLQQVKSERGKVMADQRTNTLVITDIPDKRNAYENLIKALDTQTPQVSIEARIVEATRSFERNLGIDWNFTGLADPALGTQTNLQFPHRADFKADVNLASQKQAGTLGIALGNVLDSVTLDVQLDAFEADGKVRILSSPRVVTQNNQLATIEQGVQIPVVTTTATDINVTYVPASLRLLVTPQITAEQTVIMQLTVENNQPSSTVSVAQTPGIQTERITTQILVRSGATAVIGGVYKLQETDNETGIPGLRRIPFFGWLFKNKQIKKDSSELIVFLTPKIVTNA